MPTPARLLVEKRADNCSYLYVAGVIFSVTHVVDVCSHNMTNSSYCDLGLMLFSCFLSATIEPLRAVALQYQEKAIKVFDLVHDLKGLLDLPIIGQPGESVASEINLLLRKLLALLTGLWLSIVFVMELPQNNTVCCSKT